MKRLLLVVGFSILCAAALSADNIQYDLSWSDTGGGFTATGNITASCDASGDCVALWGSGEITTPSQYKDDLLTLVPGSGSFTDDGTLITWDSTISLDVNPKLDINGLLFEDSADNYVNISSYGKSEYATNVIGSLSIEDSSSTVKIAIPEPGTVSLLGLGLVGLGLVFGAKNRIEKRNTA